MRFPVPLFVRFLKPAFSIALLSLTACASVNPVGLAKLAALDPLSADPAQIAVAARLPLALKLRTGDLTLVINTEGAEGPDRIDETFYLDVADAAPGGAGVIIAEAGERLQTARIAPADIARLQKAQSRARALEASGKSRNKGSLSVAAKGGCKSADLGSGPLVMNLFMKTGDASGYYPVVSNFDLRKQFGDELLAKLEPCS
jgi:hypothetical protein